MRKNAINMTANMQTENARSHKTETHIFYKVWKSKRVQARQKEKRLEMRPGYKEHAGFTCFLEGSQHVLSQLTHRHSLTTAGCPPRHKLLCKAGPRDIYEKRAAEQRKLQRKSPGAGRPREKVHRG